MKVSQPELAVGLEDKVQRVSQHWAAVDAVLPAAHPLLLLEDVGREAFAALSAEVARLREAVRVAEVTVALAQGVYEERRGTAREWVKEVWHWMRALLQGTAWAALPGRLPGRERGFAHWQEAAQEVLAAWREMTRHPPPYPQAWPMDLGRGRTVEEFALVLEALESSHESWRAARVELRLARVSWALALDRATACLMAYGHGVQARLGVKAPLVASVPRLWPGRGAAGSGVRRAAVAGDAIACGEGTGRTQLMVFPLETISK